MFYDCGIIKKSSILDSGKICHGFSVKAGGVSVHPYTREMNLAYGREDGDDTVFQNHEIFASAVSDGKLGAVDCVAAPQIHSSKVRVITACNKGEGIIKDSEQCDGFITQEKGILLIVRVADCTPVLMYGEGECGIAVSALHAGWRGTVSDIVGEAVRKMASLGISPEKIKVAIGAHINRCCFEVKEDMRDSVADMRDREFADRHIKEKDGRLYADMTGMNIELLRLAGIEERNIDVSPDCTCCKKDIYHSHRGTAGKRGAMGAGIAIL